MKAKLVMESLNESFSDFNSLQDYELYIMDLQKKNPEYDLKLASGTRGVKASVWKNESYLAGIRGECSLKDAYEFFEQVLINDKKKSLNE